ncbi:MAG: hypothetical protein HWD92_12635 [Flavobacteriia bacterium]|nr:hypothetical protein [Flavobacteriia bacterium]
MKSKIGFIVLVSLNVVAYLLVIGMSVSTGKSYVPTLGTYVLSGVLLCFAILIRFRIKIWKTLFGYFLIAMAFTPFFLPFSLQIGIVHVYPLIILAFHLKWNPSVRHDFLKPFQPNPSEVSDDEVLDATVQRFKNKFAGRSKSELQQLASDPARTIAARTAAKQLLDDAKGSRS